MFSNLQYVLKKPSARASVSLMRSPYAKAKGLPVPTKCSHGSFEFHLPNGRQVFRGESGTITSAGGGLLLDGVENRKNSKCYCVVTP